MRNFGWVFQLKRVFIETIARNASDTVSKITYKIPQENKREREISNDIGNSRDVLYRGILKAQLPPEEKDAGQGEGELFTSHYCQTI